ncbi:MAG TPA: hypothetical protein VGR07_05215 [Thermoanaerobaculia bacterium]|nr:hypothetical protein [Thermoanaerobaculia bacterium]
MASAPNHPGMPFDFSAPPCRPAGEPTESQPESVDMRYLGAAGLYLRWEDDSILLGPFFSNPGLWRVLAGRLAVDRRAVEQGLQGVPVSRVEAIFAGHSHYDHIGDLPVVLEMAPRARVFVNRSGVHALAPYAAGRSTALEEHASEWVWLAGERGERRPIRFFAVLSEHAPQVDHHLWQGGSLDRDWQEPWSRHRTRELQAGKTFALVIDLMSSDLTRVRYRLYYQDAANRQGVGEPPPFTAADRHPYDLAILCISSYDKVEGPPAAILRALHPRHVLVTHYEDFFRPRDRPVRFVKLLTEGKVEKYLRILCQELGCGAPAEAGPTNAVCGPSSPRWTMPLPAEWMRFRAEP